MSDEVSRKLDELFSARKAAKEAAETQVREARRRHQENHAAFVELADRVIIPTMRDFGEQLKARGIEYEVKEDGLRSLFDANPRPSVSFRFFPTGDRRNSVPHLTVMTSDRGAVMFHRSTVSPGKGGAAGGFAAPMRFEDLTPEKLQPYLLELVTEVLKP